MANKSITQQVAENIGQALRDKEVLTVLAENLIEARLADFFRPIVRVALAETLGLNPDDIGPELVEEAVNQSITAAYLAREWLDNDRIPEMRAHLRNEYGAQYDGLDNDKATTEIAVNLLIVRDEDIILANAVRDGLISVKAE